MFLYFSKQGIDLSLCVFFVGVLFSRISSMMCVADGHSVSEINHDDKTVWEKEFKMAE